MSDERTFEVKDIVGKYEEKKLLCEIIGRSNQNVTTGAYTYNEAKQIRDGIDRILMKYEGNENELVL